MDERNLGKVITELSFILWGMLAWFILSAIIIGAGAIREVIMIPALGRELAMPLSGLMVVAGAYLMLWHFMCCTMPPRNRIAYVILGLLWATLTYGFEYLLNVGLLGRSASEICQIYCFSATAVPFPLLALIAIGPIVIAYFKGQFTRPVEA